MLNQLMGKAYGRVNSFNQDLNPATFSGGSDVIVINNNGNFQCTPFYVRFGRLGIILPRHNQIEYKTCSIRSIA
ncbi:MAG: Lipin-3 [Paramarteilia canceri]